MRRVALATLRHDGLRTGMLVVGLGVAWALVTVQLGLSRGFEVQSRAIVDHVGGDVWITARGVRVVDDGEPVERDAIAAAIAPSCIERVRPILVDYTQARRPDGSLVTVQVIGVGEGTRGRVPWALSVGALEEGNTVVIDGGDAEKLGLRDGEIGQDVVLRGGERMRVSGVARGARNFTQTPYLFMSLNTARGLAELQGGAATYWVLDVRGAGCMGEVREAARGAKGVQVVAREDLAKSTSAHWIEGSGIGTLLTAGSAMAAVVALVALLQSAVTIVRTHAKELATVRALGARRSELGAFVAWQVGVVAASATLVALAVAVGMARLLRGTGLAVVVDAESVMVGVAVAALSTVVAAVIGARVLGRIDPREVLE